MVVKPEYSSQQFVGVCLAGGKTEKTCYSVIEYFAKEQKVFLRDLVDRVGPEDEESADEKLMALLKGTKEPILSVTFNAPVQFPICHRCKMNCPGVKACRQSEVIWLRDQYDQLNSKKRPNKLVTPYTERCIDFYLTHCLEEKFSPGHGLGANLAPLAARAQFLMRHIDVPVYETFVKASVWRLGRSLQIQKSVLRNHRHSVDGKEARELILKKLIEKDLAFLYVQDLRQMINNASAFEAFICAFTGWLRHKRMCEARPKGFPKTSDWVSLPKVDLEWS